MTVAREHKKRGLPIDMIVADFFHWTMQGDWDFDPINWPDVDGMISELKSMGIELMVSIWSGSHGREVNDMAPWCGRVISTRAFIRCASNSRRVFPWSSPAYPDGRRTLAALLAEKLKALRSANCLCAGSSGERFVRYSVCTETGFPTKNQPKNC